MVQSADPEQDATQADNAIADVVDLDRIVPALPFLPVKGETVLSPGDGILTRARKVTPVPGSHNRWVVAGRVIRRAIPLADGKGRQSGNDTAWMFRLVESAENARFVMEVGHVSQDA